MTSVPIHSPRARITEAQFLEILHLFALDLNASQIATLAGVNRNTANHYVMTIRKRIARHCPHHFSLDSDHGPLAVERVNGVRGRNPSTRNVLIWLFEDAKGVHTEMVPNRLVALMQAIMRGKVRADGVLEALGLADCKAIADLGSRKICHLPHKGLEKQPKRSSISAVDRFWGSLQQRIVKMRGIKRIAIPYHLKECEFRFNNAQGNLYSLLSTLLMGPEDSTHASLDREN
ncbi:MAG: hypothetical protein AB1568_04925 [Thermodesulfobacteriota bacterium]